MSETEDNLLRPLHQFHQRSQELVELARAGDWATLEQRLAEREAGLPILGDNQFLIDVAKAGRADELREGIAKIQALNDRIAELDKEITRRAREDETARRLMTVPGIGPITATALTALAPPPGTFAKGRDFAAWIGLTPRQHSTGGKQKLGAISKMGERTLRRLLIIGSSAVVLQASRRGAARGSWLEQMLARKPRMLVTVALANKTARIVWAVLTKHEDYRAPVAVAA